MQSLQRITISLSGYSSAFPTCKRKRSGRPTDWVNKSIVSIVTLNSSDQCRYSRPNLVLGLLRQAASGAAHTPVTSTLARAQSLGRNH
eukprot:2279636-Pleurochrysis_carterae.AAC.1